MAERVSQSDFDEKVLGFKGIALVDFYSDTCVPCKRMVPILTQIESEYPEGLFVAKVNVAYDGELVEKYGVSASPTFVFFKNGEEIERIVGAVKKETIEDVIKSNI